MSRTKGSLNKSTIERMQKANRRGGINIMNFDKQIENAPIIKSNAMGWVNYGSRNLYPFDLINLYNTSITHKACCDFATNAIVG